MMRRVTYSHLIEAVVVVVAMLLVFGGMRFVVADPGREPLVYFVALLVALGLSLSYGVLRRHHGDAGTKDFSRPISDSTAKGLVNVVTFAWLCLSTLILFALIKVKGGPKLYVGFVLGAIVLIAGGRYLSRRFLRSPTLLPYTAASVVAVIIVAMIAAFA